MTLSNKDILSLDQVKAYNLSAAPRKPFSGVCTDSRSVKAGELFVAIRGDRHDGNRFVSDAFGSGAACAIVDTKADRSKYADRPHAVVKDTIKALGSLANIYRRKFSIPVVAVAGSNGKTTTKEMMGAVLKTSYSILQTSGNMNNRIGVPLTIFRLQPKHELAVVEIGTNHFGELRYLCSVLEPTHGIITNIGREHLEFFKTLDGVARAESELFKALGKSGVGFVNGDDPLIVKNSKSLKKKISYGFSGRRLSVRGKLLENGKDGCFSFSVRHRRHPGFDINLSLPGKHSAMNALAAAAVGLSFDVTPKKIRRALENFSGFDKRSEIIRLGGITVINDTYNSNPDSVASAMEMLSSMPCSGNRIIILGDMLELGSSSAREHKRVGRLISKMGFEYLLTFGKESRYINESAEIRMKFHYDQKNILSEFANELISDGDIVLVKGSRGMKMEDVVTFISERFSKKGG